MGETTRREFFQLAGVGAAAVSVSIPMIGCAESNQQTRKDGYMRLKLGMASYTFRKFNLEDTLAMTKKLGLQRIALKSFHLPLESSEDEIKAVAAKVKEAGLTLYGCGVVYMENEDEVHRAFDYAQAADMEIIIGVPEHNLLNLVNKGIFREDLYYRLNVITIDIAPLRERGKDILLLVNYFVKKFAREFDKPTQRFSDNALQVLKNYYWPGNIRELQNVIQRLVVMAEGDIIDVPDLPSLMRFSALHGTGLNRTLTDVEAEHIQNVLSSVNGNKTKAAEILGIDRKTLREKLKKIKSSSS